MKVKDGVAVIGRERDRDRDRDRERKETDAQRPARARRGGGDGDGQRQTDIQTDRQRNGDWDWQGERWVQRRGAKGGGCGMLASIRRTRTPRRRGCARVARRVRQ